MKYRNSLTGMISCLLLAWLSPMLQSCSDNSSDDPLEALGDQTFENDLGKYSQSALKVLLVGEWYASGDIGIGEYGLANRHIHINDDNTCYIDSRYLEATGYSSKREICNIEKWETNGGQFHIMTPNGIVYKLASVKWSRTLCDMTVEEPDGSTRIYHKRKWEDHLLQWIKYADK